MRRIVLGLSFLVLLLVGAALVGWQQLTSYLATPAGPSSEEKVVTVAAGLGGPALVELLEKEALVQRPTWLRAYFDHFARPPKVVAGEYALSAAMAPIDILKRLESGKVVTHAVEIPAGSTAAEIVQLLAAKGLGDAKALADAVDDKKLVDRLGLPGDTLEGYLFPDTYELPRGLSASAVLEALVAHYRRVVTAGIIDTARVRGLTELELVTLASLIEKSDVLPTERRTYSALLQNRLKAGLPLESDASVLYGIARLHLEPPPPSEGAKRGDELGPDHRWNTKRNVGLPPSPIASPGLSAIVAAAEPAVSGALYLVKRADGSHVFCPDEECFHAAMKEHQPGVKIPALPRAGREKKIR